MSESPLRVTLAVQLLLRALYEDPATPRYGLELRALTRLPTTTVYLTLARMEAAGWVASRHEPPPDGCWRAGRRYYRLTALGAQKTAQALSRAPLALLVAQASR